ncbi:MAG: dihydrodipicolinate synthase family protein [Rhodoferax sp.]|nr:dihydrodipicolinate synthase family protein [Rhodoferax sp.]
MTLSDRFKGIVPPVATPYNADGSVDTTALKRLVRHLVDGGVHGLFLLGSTSECVLLDARDRALVLDTALAEAAGRVPVVAGIMDAATDVCLNHARTARSAGVDGLVVTAPYYTRTNQAETIDHFRYLRGEIGLPMVAYDIPVCVNLKLARDTVHTLVQDDLVFALKDSSGDEGGFRMLVRDFRDRPDVRLFTGSEIVADSALMAGASGCVPGLGNVDPAAYVRLYEAAMRGDAAAARREQDRLIDLFQMVFWSAAELSAGAGGVGSFKVALRHMGLFSHSHMRRPNRPVPDAVQQRIRAHLVQHGLLPAGPGGTAS